MIRIYYMKLDGDCSKEQSLALYGILPKERKESVDRAKNEGVASKRLYTGAFLQSVLSKETGLSAEQLHYRYNEWGKPELDVERVLPAVDSDRKEKVANLHFNLSHSGDYAVLAVSDTPVGIDVEHKSKNYLPLAKRCFCQEEYEDILSLDDEAACRNRFLEYWTMKEAYIKYVGEGMRIPLNSFRIERGGDGISAIEKCKVYLGTFFLDEKYCVSVCGSHREDIGNIVIANGDGTRCRCVVTDAVISCKIVQ